jgi:hypothetical protein
MPFDCLAQSGREVPAAKLCVPQDYYAISPLTTKKHCKVIQWTMKMTLLEASYCLMLYSHPKPDLICSAEVLVRTKIYQVFNTISTAMNTKAISLCGM